MQKKSQKQKSSQAFDILKGRVLYDNVLIKPITIDNLKVGDVDIATPADYDSKPEFGEVILVGDGRLLENGTRFSLEVKPGNRVFFEKYSSIKIRFEGEDYLLVREEDIRIVEK